VQESGVLNSINNFNAIVIIYDRTWKTWILAELNRRTIIVHNDCEGI